RRSARLPRRPQREARVGCGDGASILGKGHIPRPPTTCSAAALRAMAQSEDIFRFAARIAFASACVRAFLARLCSFRARLAELVAARSIRVTARSNFRVTLAGTILSAHMGPVSAASSVQRAVMHGGRVVLVVLVVVVVRVSKANRRPS